MKINKDILLSKYFEQALKATQALISIPSVKSDSNDSHPFGFGVNQALDYALKLSADLGFETYRDETNKYGFVEYGTGKKVFVILCHLDVVPAGDLSKWLTGPFDPIIQDNKLIGRGSFDDKGPTMMNLFALKYLKDHHYVPSKYTIRLIFGLSEETTWECMKKYVADHGFADAGYVPDGLFPCVYAEKWISTVELNSSHPADFKIQAGDAFNMICDMATYQGPRISEIVAKLATISNIETHIEANKLIVKGQPGHASVPYVGVNAATYLSYVLYELGVDHPMIAFIAEQVHLNFNMAKIFGDIADETGDLTQNVGILNISDKNSYCAINFRIPVFTKPEQDFFPILKAAVKKYDLSVKPLPVEQAVYIPKESKLVQTMMQVYQEVTGDLVSQPQTMGGGTYAKTMPNIIAFGAARDISKSTMHAYNEYVELDQLKEMLEIYTKSIYKLTQ